MKLELDSEACQGHGRCYSIAPELFDADAEGHSVLLAAELLSRHQTAARAAAESCPEQAISLYE